VHDSVNWNWVASFLSFKGVTVTVPWLGHQDVLLEGGKHYSEKILVIKYKNLQEVIPASTL
jgi:hypothetical protein